MCVSVCAVAVLVCVCLYRRRWYYIHSCTCKLQTKVTNFPMDSGIAVRWLKSSLTKVRALMFPRSCGSDSMQFSERWRSEREVSLANSAGRRSRRFLVTSRTARLLSLVTDCIRNRRHVYYTVRIIDTYMHIHVVYSVDTNLIGLLPSIVMQFCVV